MTVVVTVSLTVTAIPAYTDVRCPTCTRIVLQVPGRVVVSSHIVAREQDRTGRGAVCKCRHCHRLVEAVVLRAA